MGKLTSHRGQLADPRRKFDRIYCGWDFPVAGELIMVTPGQMPISTGPEDETVGLNLQEYTDTDVDKELKYPTPIGYVVN